MAKREFTPRQEAFLDALFGPADGDCRLAMKLAGYADTTPVGSVTDPLADEIVTRASRIMGANAARAALGVVAVLNDPVTLGAQHKLRAAESILDRVGITKKEDLRISGAEGGIFILPRKDDEQVSDESETS